MFISQQVVDEKAVEEVITLLEASTITKEILEVVFGNFRGSIWKFKR